MQWLIDLVLGQVRSFGMYVDRGDPAAHDYSHLNLTQDDAWHELDLSSIVPENAHAVNLYIRGRHVSVRKGFSVRKHGNVNAVAIAGFMTQAGNIDFRANVTCSLDADRKIDYWLSTPAWLDLNLTVNGWWF